MKLATYQDGSRDGQLLVVSRDLSSAHFAHGIAGRLQQLLDDWNFIAPQLEELYTGLNHGRLRHAFSFEPKRCMAPLPRAYRQLSCAAWPAHGERLGLEPAGSEPLLREEAADDGLGACAPMRLGNAALGADFGVRLLVVSGDVAQGSSAEVALEGVRLLGLANAWTLRAVEAHERNAGLAPLLSRPASAFAPVLVTPDEAGEAWRGGRLDLPLTILFNGRKFAQIESGGQAMQWHFGQLMAQACRTRRLRAGTLISAGPVSGSDAAKGLGCLAEKRVGEPDTRWAAYGDSLLIDIKGRDGQSLFGAIDQEIVAPQEEEAR